jgi:hypothetical protein
LKTVSLFIFLWVGNCAAAQNTFSIATDISLLRSFSKGQNFTSIGQTIQYQYHFAKKESVYAWLSYHTAGKFKNNFSATAKDTVTSPQRIDYSASSSLRYQQISIGWKHYFKGIYDNEEFPNLYGTAGFGLLSAKAENTFNKAVDAARYKIPQQSVAGSASLRRLTFDVGIGGEISLGGGIYFYTELRTWLPASDYPSPYLYNNDIPRVGLLNGGIRILFD